MGVNSMPRVDTWLILKPGRQLNPWPSTWGPLPCFTPPSDHNKLPPFCYHNFLLEILEISPYLTCHSLEHCVADSWVTVRHLACKNYCSSSFQKLTLKNRLDVEQLRKWTDWTKNDCVVSISCIQILENLLQWTQVFAAWATIKNWGWLIDWFNYCAAQCTIKIYILFTYWQMCYYFADKASIAVCSTRRPGLVNYTTFLVWTLVVRAVGGWVRLVTRRPTISSSRTSCYGC